MTMEKFSLADYDCVGFDLDNTVVFYDIQNMSKLIYDNFVKFLTERKGYAPKYLSNSFESGIDYVQRGLIMDFDRGNLVKMDPNGVILKATHGTRLLTETEIAEAYGPDCVWDNGKEYCQDILEAWNGPLGEKVRSVLCYFDAATTLVFARVIDTFDEENKTDYSPIRLDFIAALEHMYEKSNFKNATGDYFPALKSEPTKYIKKCPEKVINFLKVLKERGKFVFLITGSAVDFASFTASNALGPSWADFFDLVVFFARKPNFFLIDRPFLEIIGSTEGEPTQLSNNSKFYAQGNWKELKQFMEKKLGKTDSKIIYVGDSVVQDVLTPVKQKCCDAISITQENNNTSEAILRPSPIWGHYHDVNGKDTLWKNLTEKYASLSVDCLSVLQEYM